MEQKTKEINVTYTKTFLLYIIGSLFGVILEGTFYLVRFGYWETHVVSVWLPLCIIYGFGMVGCYLSYNYLADKNRLIEFIVFALGGFTLELLIGLLLEFGLGMRAWDYTKHYLNIRGHVSFQMSLGWGAIGLVISELIPYIDKGLNVFNKRIFTIFAIIFSVVTVVDLLVTGTAFYRYSQRHVGHTANNKLEEVIDETFTDQYMKTRFMEWRFLDEKKGA